MSSMSPEEIGRFAAKSEVGTGSQVPDDNIHHIGDDTGAQISAAYRQGGASAGADVLDEYLRGLNAERKSQGRTELSRGDVVKNIGWAIGPNGISEGDQERIKAVFLTRP